MSSRRFIRHSNPTLSQKNLYRTASISSKQTQSIWTGYPILLLSPFWERIIDTLICIPTIKKELLPFDRNSFFTGSLRYVATSRQSKRNLLCSQPSQRNCELAFSRQLIEFPLFLFSFKMACGGMALWDIVVVKEQAVSFNTTIPLAVRIVWSGGKSAIPRAEHLERLA